MFCGLYYQILTTLSNINLTCLGVVVGTTLSNINVSWSCSGQYLFIPVILSIYTIIFRRKRLLSSEKVDSREKIFRRNLFLKDVWFSSKKTKEMMFWCMLILLLRCNAWAFHLNSFLMRLLLTSSADASPGQLIVLLLQHLVCVGVVTLRLERERGRNIIWSIPELLFE